jgi:hypothetical protein
VGWLLVFQSADQVEASIFTLLYEALVVLKLVLRARLLPHDVAQKDAQWCLYQAEHDVLYRTFCWIALGIHPHHREQSEHQQMQNVLCPLALNKIGLAREFLIRPVDGGDSCEAQNALRPIIGDRKLIKVREFQLPAADFRLPLLIG